MIVVSDTTAITSLLKIGHLDLLRDLFGAVLIPEAVEAELLSYHSEMPSFVTMARIERNDQLILLVRDLDQGEAEAIILAEELKADALLIDEKLGRNIAQRRGVRCLGLAGALLMAKQSKLLPSLGTILDRLEVEARFHLSVELRQHLLEQAGERPM